MRESQQIQWDRPLFHDGDGLYSKQRRYESDGLLWCCAECDRRSCNVCLLRKVGLEGKWSLWWARYCIVVVDGSAVVPAVVAL